MTQLVLRIEAPDGAQLRHELREGSAVIGRSRKADVIVPDRFVSRQHARVWRCEDGWRVEAVEEARPIMLNQRVLDSSAPLHSGDVLRLGETWVHVEVAGEPVPAHGGPDMLSTESTIFKSASEIVEQALPDRSGSSPAVERSRLAERLKLLNEVHRALAEPLSLEELLERILEHAFAVFQPEEGVVLLKDECGGYRRAASRRAPGVEGELLYSRNLVAEVVEKGKAALVVDISADERFATAESIVAAGVRSILAAPLLEPDGCRGMIALSSRGAVRTFTESDMELLASLASAAGLRVRNVALTEAAAERRVLDKELALAREIQMSMLPCCFPQRPELELAAALRPARSVGGDLYDFLELPGDLWFMVGDVSGKGVGAALFMAVTKTLFHAMVRENVQLADVMARMNRELCRDNERSMFVTAFAGRLDIASGWLEFASAGHLPPYRIGASGDVTALDVTSTLPLGVSDELAYTPSRLRLEPGDALYMFTDGVIEALDDSDQAFSEARLEEHLQRGARATVSTLVESTLRAVEEFAGAAPQFDDLTVMALRYRGRGPGGAEPA